MKLLDYLYEIINIMMEVLSCLIESCTDTIKGEKHYGLQADFSFSDHYVVSSLYT